LEQYFTKINNIETEIMNLLDEISKIKEFQTKVLNELEKICKKIGESLGSSLKRYLNLKPVLNYMVAKEKVEDNVINKDSDLGQISTDFKNKIIELHDKLKDVLFIRASSSLMKHLDKFIFENTLVNYKFTEEGLIFLEKVFGKILEDLSYYDAELTKTHNSKLSETFKFARYDKSSLDEILHPIMEIRDSVHDENEKKIKISSLLNKSGVHDLTVQELEAISRMIIIPS